MTPGNFVHEEGNWQRRKCAWDCFSFPTVEKMRKTIPGGIVGIDWNAGLGHNFIIKRGFLFKYELKLQLEMNKSFNHAIK